MLNFNSEINSKDYAFYTDVIDRCDNKFLRPIISDIDISINVHESYVEFRNYLERLYKRRIPGWIAGVTMNKTIHIVSPYDPGPYHDMSTLKNTIVHEIVHLVLNKINEEQDKIIEEAICEYITNYEKFDANFSVFKKENSMKKWGTLFESMNVSKNYKVIPFLICFLYNEKYIDEVSIYNLKIIHQILNELKESEI